MLYNVYSIRDIYTGFLSPTYDLNDNAAKRNFSHAVNQNASLLHSSPKDYSLYFVGTYDTEDAVLTPACPIRLVCDAVDVLEA